MLINRRMEAQANQEATFKAQVESGRVSEQEKRQTKELEKMVELEKVKAEGESTNKNYVLSMVTSLLSKGEPIPNYLMPLINVTMENIMIPLATQNEQQKAEIVQKFREVQQQQMGGEQQETQEEMQEQPQQEIQEQQNIQSPVMA